MTKNREKGENEFTLQAKREALRSGREEMMYAARSAGDSNEVRKIRRAQKFLKCRDLRRRRRP
jgi:hypothetical protein